jgi:hypothetical protein
MTARKSFIVGAISVTLGIVGVSSAFAEVGRVRPCSLHGVNPVHHPEVFKDPETAKEHYGFIQTSQGKWQVEKGCRKNIHGAELFVPSLLKALG